MTQLGKLLVVAITILAMVFLGLSTVVFMTADNWKDKALAETKKLKDSQAELSKAQEAAQQAITEGERLANEHKNQLAQKEQVIRDTENRMKLVENDLVEVRKELSIAQATATLSSAESGTRVAETESLRDSLRSAQDQANTLKLQEKDLNQRVVDLTKDLETARKVNSRLREEVATLSTTLTKAGLSADVKNVTALASPPEVEGQISRVDETGQRIELSIGSDDGLVKGHELFVYRRTPQAQYIGKIRIIATDPERSVATVVGKTYLGTKVTEGDIVSTTIKPRS
jgi:DNA gyrase/topoisomerase IV subunit A